MKLTPDQAAKLGELYNKGGPPQYNEDGTLDKKWFL